MQCVKKTRSESSFRFETRLAQHLNAACICFYNGYALPMLWVYLFIVNVILYFTDRFLIVYYFKIEPIHSNGSIKAFMAIIKYAPVLLLSSAA